MFVLILVDLIYQSNPRAIGFFPHFPKEVRPVLQEALEAIGLSLPPPDDPPVDLPVDQDSNIDCILGWSFRPWHFTCRFFPFLLCFFPHLVVPLGKGAEQPKHPGCGWVRSRRRKSAKFQRAARGASRPGKFFGQWKLVFWYFVSIICFNGLQIADDWVLDCFSQDCQEWGAEAVENSEEPSAERIGSFPGKEPLMRTVGKITEVLGIHEYMRNLIISRKRALEEQSWSSCLQR